MLIRLTVFAVCLTGFAWLVPTWLVPKTPATELELILGTATIGVAVTLLLSGAVLATRLSIAWRRIRIQHQEGLDCCSRCFYPLRSGTCAECGATESRTGVDGESEWSRLGRLSRNWWFRIWQALAIGTFFIAFGVTVLLVLGLARGQVFDWYRWTWSVGDILWHWSRVMVVPSLFVLWTMRVRRVTTVGSD